MNRTPPYIAPARYTLGELHHPDPDAQPGITPAGEPTTGQTRCGKAMRESELWVRVDYKPGDRVCRGCNGAWKNVNVQGALL